MKPILLILLAASLCLSCSPQRRLARLVEHHPELTSTDTIRLRDTITIPGIMADTSVLLSVIREPVIVEKGRLEVVVRKVRDTLYIRGKCKPDTVVIRRNIPINRIQLIKPSTTMEFVRKIP